MKHNKKQRLLYSIGYMVILTCCLLVTFTLLIIFFDIAQKGIPSLSWNFITQAPKHGMTEGGILPAIAGTVFLTFITAIAAIPFGIICAIYLHEYATDNRITQIIRASIRNLAGIPSIIYGLFGVALFVDILNIGTSLLASGMTLGLLTLPYIIATTEEALKNIPKLHREGALALGATQWETIRIIVLPQAIPGIATGALLGLSRAAGETAPILFTGVTFYRRYLPHSVFDEFMALPYHIYILSTQHHAIEQVRPLAYTTALILILLVLMLNITATIIRYKYRLKY